MITLGIESTAHTLGIGITENGKVLSNILDIYKPPKNEGILPRNAADHHAEVFVQVLNANLNKAHIKMEDVELIAVAQGPGIGSPLSVGVGAAKYLAKKFKKNIIGINHPYAHIKISEHRTGLNDPLIVYVSGGNTQILVETKKFPHVLGETLDIGIGNLFDSFARVLGLEYAHGSMLEKLAANGTYVELPYTVKGMNLVFSGLLTHGKKFVGKESNENLAYSVMETAFAMTCEAAERALYLTNKKQIVLCGGVAQNRRLQDMLEKMARDDDVRFGVAEDEFNRDNGAMIAYTGWLLYKKYGAMDVDKLFPITRYRLGMMERIYSMRQMVD